MTEPVRLRQIAFLVHDLPKAERQITRVLNTEVINREPEVTEFGLRNILVPLGGDIIEILAPIDPTTPSTASRLLHKRGKDGGYMLIMQVGDTAARTQLIEERRLATVVFRQRASEGNGGCVERAQFNSKGIPGNIMPELDTYTPLQDQSHIPSFIDAPIAPWPPCGADYPVYSREMSRRTHLQLLGATCRLASGNNSNSGDATIAARKWEELFGVHAQGNENVFTNCRMRFVSNPGDLPDGLVSVTVGIRGEEAYERVLFAAGEEGLISWDGRVSMLGVEWEFVLLPAGRESKV
ncbi:hypothetical protein BDW42DRAFT_144628 [Aspergillus taichungensis]|uniref:Uncharacterized protein n=1 Tax=Aspergillus taichungensis TaxID=482145 RepID=A0A2J5HMF6_9EURO|nr:hypothetical protein BDW42DRAFT_144628 [Aspergillus taichungensis]